MMKSSEFVAMAKKIATSYKTIYIKGCFGSPMNASNKKRYTTNLEYNAKRASMINACSTDTFGFDCVCLVKGILWGWNGDKTKTYGGATYCKDKIPDFGTENMLNYCKGVSSDFSKIEVGEVLWMSGHAGIYIGNGLAVECTPAWDNKVQITAVSNIGTKSGYHARKWTKHGKLNYVDYTGTTTVKPTNTTTTTTTKPTTSTQNVQSTPQSTQKTLKAGTKVNIKGSAMYLSSNTKKKSGTFNGTTYYCWDNKIMNNRIRVTTSASYVGNPNQVTGWVDVSQCK